MRHQRVLGTCCAALFAGVQFLACGAPMPGPPATGTGWTTFSNGEGRFTVLVPTTPSHTTSSDGLAHRYTAQLGERVFRVSYQHGADTEIPLQDRMNAVFEAVASTARTMSTPAISGGEAIEAEYDVDKNMSTVRTRHRICYVGETMYQVIVAAPLESYDDAEAELFLDSFQTLTEESP